VDVPLIRLHNRSQWLDFREGLHQCAVTWGLPDYATTLLYGGAAWEKIKQSDLGEQLKFMFERNMVEMGGGEQDGNDFTQRSLRMLNLDEEGSGEAPTAKFVNMKTLKWEAENKLGARRKMWQWMVASLQGGNFSSLIKQVVPHDISTLYRKLKELVGSVTICALADEVESYVNLKYDPKRDIFEYLNEMSHAYSRIEVQNKLLPAGAKVEFNDAFKKTKILRALNQAPAFTYLMNRLLSMPPDEWAKTTVEQLLAMIQSHRLNSYSCEEGPPPAVKYASQGRAPAQDEAKANLLLKPVKQDQVCFQFRDKGMCKRPNCKWLHTTPEAKPRSISQSTPTSRTTSLEKNVKKPEEKGLQHCGFCHKKGHHESVCKAKVKARMDDAQDYDGREACANLLIVASPKCLRVWASEGEAMQGRERFYADSGANKHLHPEATAAATFTSHAIDVNTAEGTRAFKTDGMGAMDLETPNGDTMPGFEQVLFAKHAAERLCSIPEL